MTWHPYVTRLAHGRHPAGSECRVRASPDDCAYAELEFEDGDVIRLSRVLHSFPGTPVVSGGLIWLMAEQMALDIDSEMIRSIDVALR